MGAGAHVSTGAEGVGQRGAGGWQFVWGGGGAGAAWGVALHAGAHVSTGPEGVGQWESKRAGAGRGSGVCGEGEVQEGAGVQLVMPVHKYRI